MVGDGVYESKLRCQNVIVANDYTSFKYDRRRRRDDSGAADGSVREQRIDARDRFAVLLPRRANNIFILFLFF